ncbi:hypothetical protein [Elioraea sp.]|uniref:hypothetical protein n=1 Tax=Elioraea sp. TaxID=2185103 RepID=UPI0025C30F08|nr:hypothetical protein [Elioraea sp.]
MADAMATLRFCAWCPNLCRSAWPDGAPQREASTPSALSALTLMLAERRVAPDASIAAALGDTAMAEACRAACPYGYDIPAAVAAVAGAAHAG